MHTRRRGSSGSDHPATDDPPEWSDVDAERIEARAAELAAEGLDPSQIGMRLRDEGVDGVPIPHVHAATGKKLTEILEERDADPELPEDLRNLLERAVRLSDHMDEHPNDASNRRALQNAESKVRRLANYYRGDEIPADFEYTADNARELLED
jgi:small subunit ribosomal protein S15